MIEQDIILESLELLKKRGAPFCVCCDARDLPFKDNVFDIATSFRVLHHIWPIEKPIAELLRVTSGDIHINEPNSFALVRAARLLPRSINNKLKRFFSGSSSHSPYEASINPFVFKRITLDHDSVISKFTFLKDSWIPKEAKGTKKFLRFINLGIVHAISILSAHFYSKIRKFGQDKKT